ncbi:DUF3267 domain-containing protein [Enterococcus sp. AZ196]|uniref:DUF3267 domain-containing protein n=1 Tax=Enterococcus sp. AZ196 TaxID=2774659 RepID=UPI003D2DD0CE
METKKRSKKEKKYEVFDALCQEMQEKKYHKKDITFSAKEASTQGMLLPVPFIVLVVVGYFWRWGADATPLWEINLFLFISLFFLSIPIHELIHGLAWSYYTKNKMKSITFGFNVKELMPYCHCKEALEAKAYKIGVLAPVTVLGGGYFLLSLLYPNTELILLSAFNIFMAAGDFLIFWGARSIHEGLVIDHPELPGFVVFTKETNKQES